MYHYLCACDTKINLQIPDAHSVVHSMRVYSYKIFVLLGAQSAEV